jgi:large subunit ribosomal protein L4
MEATVYSADGKKSGSIKLPENVFGAQWNADLVKQVVDSSLSSRRKPVAHVKTRGEVAGGGKKPWKQKGTGRARHGSIRSPIWVGGGVTHGPRKDKNYTRIVPKKMKAKALFTILSRKYKDGEILFVDNFGLKENKTKEAVKVLSGLATVAGFENLLSKRKNSAVIALSSKQRETERSFKNLGNVEVVEARNMDLVSLLGHKYLVIENPEEAFKVFPGSALTKKKNG